MVKSRLHHEELEAHRKALVEEYLAKGLSESEAQRAANIKLGGSAPIEEAWREQRLRWRTVVWLDHLRRDVGYAIRALRRAPLFTAVVVTSLALGIGANTAVFSVLSAALLRRLPVAEPKQLSMLYWNSPRTPRDLDDSGTNDGLPPNSLYSLAYPDFVALQQRATSIAGGVATAVFGWAPLGHPDTVVANGAASQARATIVTADYFGGIGLASGRGRLLGATDYLPGTPLAAVISDAFWTKQFGRNANTIGATIVVDQHPVTVIGVARAGFEGLEPGHAEELWLPARAGDGLLPWGGYQPEEPSVYDAHRYWWLQVMVRRRAGVSDAALLATLAPEFHADAAEELRTIMRSGDQAPRLGVIAGAQGINGQGDAYGETLRLLSAGVALLLLLACVNIASLLLARASARRREIGVRMALGAGRGRLVSQLLTESVLLALVGGAAGVALAPLAARVLNGWLAGRFMQPALPRLDAGVLSFAAAVSLITGIGFGLAPALRSTRLDLMHAMKRGPADSGTRGLWTDKGLAAAQVALSLLLVIGAGLLVRTLLNLTGQPLGFDPSHVLTFAIDGRQSGHQGAELPLFYAKLQQRLAALPGVAAVSASQHTLLGGDSGGDDVRIPSSSNPIEHHSAMRNGVGGDFFATMRVPILRGRALDTQDVADGAAVAVIDEEFARKLFGGGDPLGRAVNRRDGGNKETHFTIVGVAANSRYSSLRRAADPAYYIPYTEIQGGVRDLTFEVRTAGGEARVIEPEIRRAVHELDSNLALGPMETQVEQDGDTLVSQRLLAHVSEFFAALGLLLACLGIEGTMAYAVTRRTGEIGLRIALGARPGQVLLGVLREATKVAALGVAAGCVLALVLTRMLESQLFGIKPHDPGTLAGAALLLLAVAVWAAWIPARRAAKVDPLTALRAE